jgi:hypothetical protein
MDGAKEKMRSSRNAIFYWFWLDENAGDRRPSSGKVRPDDPVNKDDLPGRFAGHSRIRDDRKSLDSLVTLLVGASFSALLSFQSRFRLA